MNYQRPLLWMLYWKREMKRPPYHRSKPVFDIDLGTAQTLLTSRLVDMVGMESRRPATG